MPRSISGTQGNYVYKIQIAHFVWIPFFNGMEPLNRQEQLYKKPTALPGMFKKDVEPFFVFKNIYFKVPQIEQTISFP
jgi:hypothetical protein